MKKLKDRLQRLEDQGSDTKGRYYLADYYDDYVLNTKRCNCKVRNVNCFTNCKGQAQ